MTASQRGTTGLLLLFCLLHSVSATADETFASSIAPDRGAVQAKPLRIAHSAKENVCQPISSTLSAAARVHQIENGAPLTPGAPLPVEEFQDLIRYLRLIPGITPPPALITAKNPAAANDVNAVNAFILANRAAIDAFTDHLLQTIPFTKAIAINRDTVQCTPSIAGAGYTNPAACMDSLAKTCSAPSAAFAGGLDLAAGLSGASWQTAALSGLASFMTDRASQELVVWLVDVFENQLCDHARGWFTQTCDVFDKYRDQAPGTLLASAVRADVEALPISAFKAIFARAGELRSILAEMRDKRHGSGSGVKQELTSLIADVTPDLIRDCGSTASGVQLVCGIGAGFYVLVQLGEIVINPWNETSACQKISTVTQNKAFKKVAANKHFPAGIVALANESPSNCTTHSYQPQLNQLLGLLKETNSLAASLRSGQVPAGQDVTATILNDATRFINLAAGYAKFADPQLTGTVTNDLMKAVSAAEIADEIYALLLNVRKGLPPLDIIAGLADAASKLPICSSGQPQTVGCIITSAATLVANLGALRTKLVDGNGKPIWDETIVCTVLQDFGTSSAVEQAFIRAYGGAANIPTKLKTFFDTTSAHLQCSSPNLELDGYKELRDLARSIFQLEVWLSNPPQGGTQGAAQAIGLIHDVIESGAAVFAPAGNDDVNQLLAAMTALGDILRGEFTDGIRQLLVIVAAHADLFPDSVRQYVVLVGDLASAKSPGDVNAALSSAAMPVGSWKFKRANMFTLTITGVVGAQFAYEVPTSTPASVNLANGYAVGPLAALGLDFQFKLGSSSWTMGAFLSLIDVGQLAWARVTDTGKDTSNQQNAATQSEVSFLSVLSPGLFLKLGLGRSPLTFGLGASFAPKLRKYSYVDPSGLQTSDAFNTLRVGIWLAVDLTLFPLAHVQ